MVAAVVQDGLKRPSCFSLLCVRIHVCVTMPAIPSFQKQLDCANIF